MFFVLHLAASCLNDVLFKLLGQSLPPVQVTFMRFFFATVSILIFAILRNQSLSTKVLHIHALRGFILFAGMSLWCFGLTHTPLADAIIINFTIPIFLLVLCAFILKEKVETRRWAATMVTFIGILIVTKPTSGQFNPYSLVMIITAAIFACCDIINKIYATKESTLCSIFYTALFTSLSALGYMIISTIVFKSSFLEPQSTTETFYTLLLGIGANITLYLILKSFELIEASETASIRYLEIVFSAVAGFIFFGEIPTTSTIVGAAFVIPTTLFIVLQESQSSTTNSEKELQAA